MKFESKFGLGEIVVTKQQVSPNGLYTDIIARVLSISFGIDGSVVYHCRIATSGIMSIFLEDELIGDPRFDQEHGYAKEHGNAN